MRLKKILPLTIVIGSALLFSLFTIAPSFRPHSLGEKVQYLGVESFGRAPFTDSSRFDIYYYGTDLESEQLAQYFHGQIVNVRGLPEGSAEYSIRLSNGNEIPIQFYKDKNNAYSAPPDWARNTNKRYFFFILDGYYSELEQAISK